ncbi:hypothetical protein QFC21_006665 [Naganishia friedmannii]|uniref:Uncharacterized protein n=1 Tax=Naganishia friedmannii TaxID=89922 RepID=A0ACC2V1H7_9TREE|nr:hypothetical protein QFC21_006665 [Naganishia friedmannii]
MTTHNTGIEDQTSIKPLRLALRGTDLLRSEIYNKGSAFTERERDEFGLRGRLPFTVNTLEQQLERAYDQYQNRKSDIRKNSFLQSLKVQNQVLFYNLLTKHLEEMADAIAEYSHLFRQPEGLYISPPSVEKMEEDFLEACAGRELDLGSGGIGISSAKAVIYSLVAGIDPARTLAVVLDVGTNNPELRNDELYLGWNHDRVRGEEYDSFVDKFAKLVVTHQPQCLLHFEDFGVSNAQKLLDRYATKQAVFNDDIQGTGAVTLATLTSALQVTQSKLSDQRIIQFGAGSAGLGIARQIRDAMVLVDGTDPKVAAEKFWLVDKNGLLKKGLGDKIRSDIEEDFIRKEDDWGANDETHLLDVVKKVKPTVLIGTSTAKGAFTEDVIREMAKHTEQPIIFPLSNPTRLAECTPEDAQKWTNGKALVSTGSPFPPVDLGNGKKYTVAECNNALVYPGIGLGAIVSRAKRVTDKMIIRAAQVLGEMGPASADKPEASLLPDFADSQKVAVAIALEVMDQAIREGVADFDDKALLHDKDARKIYLESKLWKPEYREYVYDPDGRK